MAFDHDALIKDLKTKKNDYYAVLNVSKTATEDEILRSYKKLALRLHPDKCKHKEGEEMFKFLGDVKEVLTDPTKKRLYDDLGVEGLKSDGANANSDTVPFATMLVLILDVVFRRTMYYEYRHNKMAEPYQPPQPPSKEPTSPLYDYAKKAVAAIQTSPLSKIPVPYLFALPFFVVAFALVCNVVGAPVVAEYCLHHPNPQRGLTHGVDMEYSFAPIPIDGGGKRKRLGDRSQQVQYYLSRDVFESLRSSDELAAFQKRVAADLDRERGARCNEARKVAGYMKQRDADTSAAARREYLHSACNTI